MVAARSSRVVIHREAQASWGPSKIRMTLELGGAKVGPPSRDRRVTVRVFGVSSRRWSASRGTWMVWRDWPGSKTKRPARVS